MKKNAFGSTGWQVTEVGFGAWGIGSKHYGDVQEAEAFDALSAYIKAGGNFIDTARGYNTSESIIGRFLKGEGLRDDVILCSKIWPTDEASIRADADESLRQFQVDCVDLMYLHNPPAEPDEMNRVLDVFCDLQEQGKIRAIGASIRGGNVTSETQDLCRQYMETGRIQGIQLIFSILRQGNRAVFDYAADRGVGLVGRTCLENGFLSGKYEPGHRFEEGFPDGDHRSRWNGHKLDAILEIADDLKARYAKAPYETLAQVALRFCLDQDGLPVIIPGAKNARQARANVAAADLPSLSADVHSELRERFAGREDIVNL